MSKKVAVVIASLFLIAVGFACLGIVLLGGGADQDSPLPPAVVGFPEPTRTSVPEAPSERDIHAKLDNTTDLVRDEYLRSLHGLRFSMTGLVDDVDSGSHVRLSGACFDAHFRLSKEEAVKLGLGQSIQVTGIIESWGTSFGLTVYLENVVVVIPQ